MPLRVGDEESVVETCDLESVCGSARSGGGLFLKCLGDASFRMEFGLAGVYEGTNVKVDSWNSFKHSPKK